MLFFFFFKQKTAYEMRISDWSSDVCSSDLFQKWLAYPLTPYISTEVRLRHPLQKRKDKYMSEPKNGRGALFAGGLAATLASTCCLGPLVLVALGFSGAWIGNLTVLEPYRPIFIGVALVARSEEHTSELQSLMR